MKALFTGFTLLFFSTAILAQYPEDPCWIGDNDYAKISNRKEAESAKSDPLKTSCSDERIYGDLDNYYKMLRNRDCRPGSIIFVSLEAVDCGDPIYSAKVFDPNISGQTLIKADHIEITKRSKTYKIFFNQEDIGQENFVDEVFNHTGGGYIVIDLENSNHFAYVDFSQETDQENFSSRRITLEVETN